MCISDWSSDVCSSNLVQDTIADRFTDAVRDATSKLVVGDPRVEGTNIGPLIHPEHFERVAGFVERALAHGAKPLIGGKPADLGGNWFEPTILTGVEQSSEIVQEEVFGPVDRKSTRLNSSH